MANLSESPLTAVLAFAALLIAAAVLGKLYGKDEASIVKATGDRVACGLLALPLISVATHLVFPSSHIGWSLAAPLPFAVYVVLLACTDINPPIWLVRYFSQSLVIIVGVIYLAMGIAAWHFSS